MWKAKINSIPGKGMNDLWMECAGGYFFQAFRNSELLNPSDDCLCCTETDMELRKHTSAFAGLGFFKVKGR